MSVPGVATDRVALLIREASDDGLARGLRADVLAIVRAVLGPCHPHVIDTAVNDALLAVVRYRHGFRGTSRGSTWLFTIARRAAVRVARQEARFAASEVCIEDEAVELEASRNSAVEVDPVAAMVALEVLAERVANPEWRRIWLLYSHPELRLTHEEIAARLGYTAGSVAATLSKVRARIGEPWLRESKPLGLGLSGPAAVVRSKTQMWTRSQETASQPQ